MTKTILGPSRPANDDLNFLSLSGSLDPVAKSEIEHGVSSMGRLKTAKGP
jgi:hypothetical protein